MRHRRQLIREEALSLFYHQVAGLQLILGLEETVVRDGLDVAVLEFFALEYLLRCLGVRDDGVFFALVYDLSVAEDGLVAVRVGEEDFVWHGALLDGAESGSLPPADILSGAVALSRAPMPRAGQARPPSSQTPTITPSWPGASWNSTRRPSTCAIHERRST